MSEIWRKEKSGISIVMLTLRPAGRAVCTTGIGKLNFLPLSEGNDNNKIA